MLDILVRRRLLTTSKRQYEPAWRTAARRAGALLINGLVTSAVVFLAALPLVALRFHLVSPIGIFLNIPLIPFTTAALLLGGVSLLLSTLWAPLGAPFAWAAAGFLKVTRLIVLWGVGLPWGHRFVVGPSWGWVLVFYVVLVLAVVARAQTMHMTRFNHHRLLLVLPWWVLLAWVIPGWLFSASLSPRDARAEAEFLSVGHGLAVRIRTPDDRAFLYDCGRLGDPSVGRRIVAPALWARGVSRIDAVLLSHADQDHYNGVLDLLDRFPIGIVHISPGFGGPANPSAVDLLARIRSRGVPIRTVTAPESWETAGVSFTIRHPPADWGDEATDNARSIVVDVASRGRHMLLTGDLELSGLDELVAQPRPTPPPDVILAPHHGGRAANPERLYEWAKPRLVVASQRAPSSATSDALAPIERLGIPVLRTWRRGAIRIQWTDEGLVARAFLDENGTELRTVGSGKADDTIAFAQAGRSQGANSPRAAGLAPAVELLVGLTGFVVGALACLFLAVVEIGAWALVMPYRSVATSAVFPPGGGALADDVDSIAARASDGSRLVARWFPAPGASATGRTVLLLHGFAETSRALEAARAAALNRFGWNVAALDSRGHGQSEGHYSTFGGLEAKDIQAWLDELAGRLARNAWAPPFQPVLWGRSMGAAIALRAAALDSRTLALVLEAPLVDLFASTVVVLRRRRFPFPKFLARRVVRRARRVAGMPIDRPSPMETAPLVRCPTVVIHGTDDSIVPIGDARRLASAFARPPCWFKIKGAKHIDVVDVGGQPLLEQVAVMLERAVGAKGRGGEGMTRNRGSILSLFNQSYDCIGKVGDFGLEKVRPLPEDEDRADQRSKAPNACRVRQVECEKLHVVTGNEAIANDFLGRVGVELGVFLAHCLQHRVRDLPGIGTGKVSAHHQERDPVGVLQINGCQRAVFGDFQGPLRWILESNAVVLIRRHFHRSARSLRKFVQGHGSIGHFPLPIPAGAVGRAAEQMSPARQFTDAARLGRSRGNLVDWSDPCVARESMYPL